MVHYVSLSQKCSCRSGLAFSLVSLGREKLWAQNHLNNDGQNTPMVNSSINMDKLHIDLSRICETSRVLCQDITVLAEIDTFFPHHKDMYKLSIYLYIYIIFIFYIYIYTYLIYVF